MHGGDLRVDLQNPETPGLTPGNEYGIMREIKRLNKGWRGTTSSARKEIIR